MRFGVTNNSISNALMWIGAAIVLLLPNPLFDPDFGWHLRTGLEILSRGEVPRIDWFSFTLADYPWVSHEWLQDVCAGFFYNNFGLFGVRVWYLILGLTLTAAILALLKQRGLNVQKHGAKIALIVSLIVVALKLFRPQIVTAIGFTLVLMLLQEVRQRKSANRLRLLPFIFLIWCNLHAGFPIGFFLIGVFFLAELFIPVKNNPDALPAKELAKIAFWGSLAFAATFMNAYGPNIYREILGTVFDPVAKESINEWLPLKLDSLSGQLSLIAVVMLVANVLLERVKIRLSDLILMIVTGILAVSSIRHVPFFLIVSLSVLTEIETSHSDYSELKRRVFAAFDKILLFTAFAIVLFIPIICIWNIPYDRAPEKVYPVEALRALPQDKTSLRVFNEYSWGGYMVYAEPQLKTFIDGRMTHWRYKDQSLLHIYSETLAAEPIWPRVFEEFEVNAVLIPPKSKLADALHKRPEWMVLHQDEISILFYKKG